jgi:tRNA pseudouridine38-40 synthase
MPSYILIAPKPGSKLLSSLEQEPAEEDVHPFWKDCVAEPATDEDLIRKRKYRVSTTEIETFRKIMMKYEGTHNFHNFTVRREYNDKASRRFMKTIEVCESL